MKRIDKEIQKAEDKLQELLLEKDQKESRKRLRCGGCKRDREVRGIILHIERYFVAHQNYWNSHDWGYWTCPCEMTNRVWKESTPKAWDLLLNHSKEKVYVDSRLAIPNPWVNAKDKK